MITLARGVGINPLAAAFSVIWMANLGSLLLPISNLTNLLAVQTDVFGGVGSYVAVSWLPSLALGIIAVVAPLVLARWVRIGSGFSGRTGGGSGGGVELDREAKVFAGLIGVLLVALLLPGDVWLPITIAALVSLGLLRHWSMPTPVHHMIPWATLMFVFSLSTGAAIIHTLGLLDPVLAALSDSGLFILAFASAALANLINNIPWASLATLLWVYQARQQDVGISWRLFVSGGLVLGLL